MKIPRTQRITTVCCALVCAWTIPPLSADGAKAATKYVVLGAGWGHGIGMSQYGAQGFAQNGRSYREILAHYYQKTDLRQAKTKNIRVLLKVSPRVTFSGATRASGGRKLDAGKTYSVRREAQTLKLYDNTGKLVDKYSGAFLVSGSSPVRLGGTAINGVTNGRYRGTLEVSASGFSGVTVVNSLDLDFYVKGVLPGEMPTSWRPEALKSQAVAARTYALATDAGGSLFDQYPDTRSQVYRGADSEVASSNAAVNATAGEAVHYNGKIAATYFFSTSGGRTENIENVWQSSSPRPWLVSVRDPYDSISPRHRWRFTWSSSTLDHKLDNWVKGRLRGIKVIKRGVSRRVVTAEVIGTRGRTRVTGSMLRSRLGLFDTWVSFKKVTGKKPSASNKASLSGLAELASLVNG